MKLGEIIKSIKNRFSNLIPKNKKTLILCAVLVVTIALSLVFFPNKTSDNSSHKNESNDSVANSASYSEMVERKIKSMLLSIAEVTNAEVMVVCESTEIYEYLMNRDETKGDNNSSTIREEVAFEKDGSNSTPIIISSKMPKILGVWIIINEVAPSTKLAITNSIESVLNIDKSCISILQER